MIALETTPDKHLKNFAVYGSTRAQATDVVDKVCVSGLEVHFLKIIPLVQPKHSNL